MMDITKPLVDRIRATHPTLGDLSTFCSYEKVTHACRFCGFLGHEMQSCHEYNRLSAVLSKPGLQDQFYTSDLLSPKKAAWMINPACIHR